MSTPSVFEACLACGLERGTVSSAFCVISADRLGFTLSLTVPAQALDAGKLLANIVAREPHPESISLESPEGSLLWRRGVTEASPQVYAGVRFRVRLDTVVVDQDVEDWWEACRARWGVRLDVSFEDGHVVIASCATALVRHRPELYVGPAPRAVLLIESVLAEVASGVSAGTTSSLDVLVTPEGRFCVTDDGRPFSFERREPFVISWAEAAAIRLPGQDARRCPDDDARLAQAGGPGLLIVNALSREFSISGSAQGRTQHAKYLQGRRVELGPCSGWGADGSRIDFIPDTDLIAPATLPEARQAVETVAAQFPGRSIRFNGVELGVARRTP